MKLLDTIAVPNSATHVAIHLDNEGKMGTQLRLEREGQVYELFALGVVTREMLLAEWGEKDFRFAFYEVKEGEAPKRLGPRGGAVSIRREAPAVAPSPAAPALPGPGVMSNDGMAMFAFLEGQRIAAKREADADANRQIERERQFMRESAARDREFFLALQNATKAPTALTVEDYKRMTKEVLEEELDKVGTPAEGEGGLAAVLGGIASKVGDSAVKALDKYADNNIGVREKTE